MTEVSTKSAEEISARLAEFVVKLAEYCNEKNINKTQYKIVIEVKTGRKYTRITRHEQTHGSRKPNPFGIVHCFINNEDGSIWRAANFDKIEPHSNCGSIFAEGFDIGENKAVNQFGCKFIK